ncbi:heat shock protein HslJ [Acinetobacter calcoaceticus]|uniref:Heat shock protein HslJ n=1 Tax=Acinetobacter calcoaceticus TaxID=471 RepID=A0A4R1Y400_ACICA|nr:heat shock protein HslJ [Acinetobacter calcoaceticus]
MKIKLFAIALLPFALAACQTTELQQVKDSVVNAIQQPNTAQTLVDYQWSYQPTATQKPIVLNFAKQDQRLSISTGCNTLNTSWRIDNGLIITGNGASTMKACEPALMKQEQFVAALFNNAKVPFSVSQTQPQTAVLTIITAQGEKLVFNGEMTAEAKYQSQPETIFLEISPVTKSCTGVAPQTCLQVREIKFDQNGVKTQVDKDWTYFYDGIQGFTHVPTERQVVRIKRYEIKNPAADQSKYAYVQDMIVEREQIK